MEILSTKEICKKDFSKTTNAIKLTLHSKMNYEEALIAVNIQNWKKI